ncbi:hypothetical protein LuPra_03418 [Luteitalea pratensis]|uniref:Uncharacterized protein n=1 Tax=Luteitalea pratensis TaxID=1855912 RepID=A0A143PQW8_LUTPR|nr:hypothetical protein LuPra_03418 [Luteitalea pratensis]
MRHQALPGRVFFLPVDILSSLTNNLVSDSRRTSVAWLPEAHVRFQPIAHENHPTWLGAGVRLFSYE